MNQLFQIYETLRQFDLCNSQADFAIHWLGKSRCYMSYLKASGAHPDLASVGMLVARLEPIVEDAKVSAPRSKYRQLRTAHVSAKTLYSGLYQIKFVDPWYRISV